MKVIEFREFNAKVSILGKVRDVYYSVGKLTISDLTSAEVEMLVSDGTSGHTVPAPKEVVEVTPPALAVVEAAKVTAPVAEKKPAPLVFVCSVKDCEEGCLPGSKMCEKHENAAKVAIKSIVDPPAPAEPPKVVAPSPANGADHTDIPDDVKNAPTMKVLLTHLLKNGFDGAPVSAIVAECKRIREHVLVLQRAGGDFEDRIRRSCVSMGIEQEAQ